MSPPAHAASKSPGEPPEFANVRLLVRDFGASWRFYHDLLGLRPQSGNGEGPYAEFVWNGVARLGIFDARLMAAAVGLEAREASPTLDVGHCTVVFEVEDVDARHRELRDRGANILAPPTDRPAWSLRTLHLRDPDGNVVEFYQRPR